MIDGKKIMFGKIFITQLRNCVMLVTPLLANAKEQQCWCCTCDWKGNHRSAVAVAVWHRQQCMVSYTFV